MSRQFEQECFIQAPPERVWRALTDPAEMAKWMGREVEAEPRPGGRLHVAGLHPGFIVEFDPPRRLVWSWDPDDGTEPNTETITLEPESGGTRLRVTVEARGKWATDLMYFGGIEAGWQDWLDALAGWVVRGEETRDEPMGLFNAGLAAEPAGAGQRLFVKSLRPGGAADLAGVREGDTIRAIDGRLIERVADFWRVIWHRPPGARVRLDLQRDGRPVTVEVTLAAPAPRE